MHHTPNHEIRGVMRVGLRVAAGLALLAAATALAEGERAPLFDGMGSHTRTVSTKDELAQRYFNQGLVWAYAFNHDEAIRSFKQAAELDPQLAIAWWGVALCNGPHINNPVVPQERAKAAWEALQKARALREHASPIERELIDALAARYADPQPEDRSGLDQAYAAAMERVWKQHRDDADIGTLYAESLMDLQPWDMWTKDGKPKGRAEEIIAVLEHVLKLDPKHPGATHLYIHAVEAGPNPERANAAADALRNAVSISGHLTHMPSHIDVQTGRWSLAADQNAKAIEADARYYKISPRQGFYRLYMAHNHHFLCFASQMEGREERALKAARDMVASVPEEALTEQATLLDPYMMVVYDVLMRFGRWDELLNEPGPAKTLPITTCFWHFKRAVAYAAKGQVAEARQEQQRFHEAVERVPEGAMMAINPAEKVLRIAELVLSGEIAYREGRLDAAVEDLRKAVAIEDELTYMEPPDWSQPVRHTLGAVLVDAKRFSEAEQVYREDLENWPENGWSLFGLAQCLRARGATAEAEEVEARFRKAWSRADTKIASSCLCVKGRPE